MFDWINRIQSSASAAQEILEYFEQMLEDDRHIFDLAANALVAGTDTDAIKEEIWATDKRVNRNERRIRRRLVTHGATHGRGAFASDLVMMSLVKDAERIGDQCKNIFDLAAMSRELPPGVKDELTELKDSTSRFLVRARNIYRSENEADARAFLAESEAAAKRCDRRSIEMVMSDDGHRGNAAAALAYRYFKRVIAHTTNVITSVVMPLDRLDYFDEDIETR